MKFIVLGSGTTVPDADRGPAGFVVQVSGKNYLVDGGTGTLQRAARAGVNALKLTGGIYSHRHLDHIGDLAPLLFSMFVRRREENYPLWGGEGLQAYVDGLHSLYGRWIVCGQDGATVTELKLQGPDEADLGNGLLLRTLPAVHQAGALHLRFEADGAAVVFSGDTGPSENLAKLAKGVDLLVCECAEPDHDPYEYHLTPSQVAAIVDEARPREVWLTHFYPEADPEEAVRVVAKTGVRVRRAHDLDVWNSA